MGETKNVNLKVLVALRRSSCLQHAHCVVCAGKWNCRAQHWPHFLPFVLGTHSICIHDVYIQCLVKSRQLLAAYPMPVIDPSIVGF